MLTFFRALYSSILNSWDAFWDEYTPYDYYNSLNPKSELDLIPSSEQGD